MANVSYREVIGVCGLIGCGKSHVAKLIAEKRGYQYVNSDSVFKNRVLTNESYKIALQSFLDIFEIQAFVGEKYNSKEITTLLFNNMQKRLRFPIIKALNRLNYSYISEALREEMFTSHDCILEMATLPSFEELGKKVRSTIMVMGDGWENDLNNKENYINRVIKDHYKNPEYSKNISEYQRTIMSRYINSGNDFFQLENMNTDSSSDEGEMFQESFKTDSEILAEFDEIIKSSRALIHVGF